MCLEDSTSHIGSILKCHIVLISLMKRKKKKLLFDSPDRSSNTYLFKRMTGRLFEADSA